VITRKTSRGIILLALLATLTGILSREQGEIRETPLNQLDTRLNYALYDFDGRLLNKEGGVNLDIKAPVLRNDDQSGVGTVDSPQIQILQEGERWYITAESAIIAADREHVSLLGDVELTRLNETTGQQLDISTMNVMLNVTPRTAHTAANVTIVQDGDRLDAVGMNLDMIANSFELLENVRAHYEIP
jgi:LPS export ABC transporter protein LptC